MAKKLLALFADAVDHQGMASWYEALGLRDLILDLLDLGIMKLSDFSASQAYQMVMMLMGEFVLKTGFAVIEVNFRG